ncbi:MAG: PIN domain-containing protein [archaeon]
MPTRLQNERVALDTNMLLAIRQLKVDVFSEVEKMFGKKVEFAVPEQVLAELKGLALAEGKEMGKSVAIALAEIGGHCVEKKLVEAPDADAALAKMAKQGFVVASNDAGLRKRIKGFGGKVMYLRQSRFLELE